MLFDKKYATFFFPFFFIVFVAFSFYNILISLLLVGLLFVILSIAAHNFLDDISKNGIESTGKIVSYTSDDEGHKTPNIEYQTADGRNFVGQPFVHGTFHLSKFNSYQKNINTKIAILYSAKSPEKFIVKEVKTSSLALSILIIIGLALIVYAVVGLLGCDDVFEVALNSIKKAFEN
ncbi:hypothetical protein HNP37_003136 [Flavobacterium nitrogenifigens]|uniref:DUF3592 domain-containing protein n=2 Tax=Flavobacterium TaxID=237 RepID=A0A7W7IYS1_9FLAO|nr:MULTISPECIES: DUF3592 domain-containing protein [Flavobacterium]MBB4803061.1 hypothetical protein [Flavobacterium nitrogenifigens]MBB6388019.1 hypothetical protein [Flavobacterium notoginsengisoli]